MVARILSMNKTVKQTKIQVEHLNAIIGQRNIEVKISNLL